jgi:AcrR family transcriptional regulator
VNPVPTRHRPLRADAMRNHQRILAAARELFESNGLDITLDAVADHAGVGVGTVYRRFANKQELIVAVFEDNIHRLVDQADVALRNPDSWVGLTQFLDFAYTDFAANRGLSELVRMEGSKDDRMMCIREQLRPAVDRVIERARTAGVLRPGVESSDFFALVYMINAVAVFARPVNPQVWRRYFEIVLDGLRADSVPRQPITTSPMTVHEEHAAKLVACLPRRQ